jgi:hypothetical protein
MSNPLDIRSVTGHIDAEDEFPPLAIGLIRTVVGGTTDCVCGGVLLGFPCPPDSPCLRTTYYFDHAPEAFDP